VWLNDFNKWRSVKCPKNWAEDPTNNSCRLYNGSINPDKNLGQCGVGNPIHPGFGNKYQVETDYVGPGPAPLLFRRTYNSYKRVLTGPVDTIGYGWRSNLDRTVMWVQTPSITTAFVYRPDGKVYYFNLENGQYVADADIVDRLVPLTDTAGSPTGWEYTTAGEEVETYDVKGRLLSVRDRHGLTQTFSRNAEDLVTAVSDTWGRVLTFTYDESNRIATMTDPAGGVYTYAYDTAYGRLTSVTYPDGKVRTYVYNESVNTSGAHLPYVLTGIMDENGNRFATYKYDTSGRAISSEHAGGAEKVTLTYNSSTTTTVTDALGTARTYGFQTSLGVVKNTSVSQACSNCGGGASTTTYDANGNVSSKTDFNGNRTNYSYDLARNLETSRTEGLTSTGATTSVTRTITTQWLPSFRLPTQITEPGRVTVFTYDPNGDLLSKTITSGAKTRTWAYTYNALGQVLTVNGPRTDVADLTTYSYDAQGNVATITNALGHITRITDYDAHGHPLRIEDPNGLVTILAYDARGRLTSRTTGTEKTDFEYDGVGQLKKAILPTGAFLNYTYDPAHRLTDIQDNLGNAIHYTLDPMGNRTKEDVLDPQGTLKQTHSRVYNSLNRLIQDIGATGQTTQYGYDPNGNLTTRTDPLNQTTTNTYDKLNRLVDVQDPLQGHTQTQYDPLDQITRILDPLGSATDYAIDGLGDTEETVSPDTGVTQRSFDAAGNVVSETDARGKTTTHRYDALNRLIQTTFDDGTELTYIYDTGTANRGRLMQLTDPSGSTSWSYDGHGRPTQRRQHLDGIQLTVNYAYDAQGLLIDLTYPSGKAVTFGYDLAGRINRIQAGDQTIVEDLSYHPFGPVTGWRWGNGSPHTRSLDLDGRISAYSLVGTTETVGYDLASRITAISGAESKSYGYDALDRLTSATAPGIIQTYSYDPNGNRLTETLGAETTSYGYTPGSNRLQTRTQGTPQNYTHDPAGNLIADGTHTYTYDARGRMVQSTTGALTTSYRHNGLGQRVSKTAPGSSAVSRRFVYDEAGHLICEYDGAGAPVQETVYLGDSPIAVPSGTDGIHYVHADQISTPRVITDTQGAVVWRWESDPFGVGVADQDPDADGLAFVYNSRMSGQYFDVETGLYYNYFRDYAADIGRYVQSDPIGLAGGLNTYRYVTNNPLNLIDPQGLLFGGLIDAGESYGDSATQYWADTATQSGNPLYHIPGALAALWTPDTSDATAATLVCGAGIGRYLARPFWQYYPLKNPGYSSPWFTRGWGWKPPQTPGPRAAERLSLPPHNPGTAARPATPPSWQPVRGPRPVEPQFGQPGGGWEYKQGWRW
jgi:RHS repeat-associated protein